MEEKHPWEGFCQQEWFAEAKAEQEPKADFGGAPSCAQRGAGSPSRSGCSEELTAGTRCPRKQHTLVPESPRLHSRVVTSCRDRRDLVTSLTWCQLGWEEMMALPAPVVLLV